MAVDPKRWVVESGVDPYNGFSLDQLLDTEIGGSTIDSSDRRHSAGDLLSYAKTSNIRFAVHASVERVLVASDSANAGAKQSAVGMVYRGELRFYLHAMAMSSVRRSSTLSPTQLSPAEIAAPSLPQDLPPKNSDALGDASFLYSLMAQFRGIVCLVIYTIAGIDAAACVRKIVRRCLERLNNFLLCCQTCFLIVMLRFQAVSQIAIAERFKPSSK
ncbi:hypothetical protein RHGRI_038494 [Rhododendron griersonianum]|uniref:Uncharacterized protein n=1 Tax=Rhododendron griersonianum TaxID=479676 RepID=A0AAV6HJ54_9ERIC|nr:hypothetical protein RHGRI_038494 [Rhododendron griersonianum]